VVLKLNSRPITHKTDVGGVKLDLRTRRVRGPYADDGEAPSAKAGPEHFLGVTVQPMLKLTTATS
jgi:acetyltransferase